MRAVKQMRAPSENQQGQPTEEQLKEASQNGVLRWKEFRDIEHIKAAVSNGCVCDLCETARSVSAQTKDNSTHASGALARRLDWLLKMRKGTA
jgi:hypothetical protein